MVLIVRPINNGRNTPYRLAILISNERDEISVLRKGMVFTEDFADTPWKRWNEMGIVFVKCLGYLFEPF